MKNIKNLKILNGERKHIRMTDTSIVQMSVTMIIEPTSSRFCKQPLKKKSKFECDEDHIEKNASSQELNLETAVTESHSFM